MPITRRYQPPHPPGESCSFGMDFSFIVPVGVGLTTGSLSIFKNSPGIPAADSDWIKGPVTVRGRAIYANLSGGVDGSDYQLRWSATDTQGNVWPRTALVLCTQTS